MANLSPSMPYTARSSIGVRRRPSPDSEAMARSMLRASMTRPTTAQKQSHSDLTAPPRRNNLPDRHAVFTALPASVNRERQVAVVVSRIALGSCNAPARRRMFTLRMGRKRDRHSGSGDSNTRGSGLPLGTMGQLAMPNDVPATQAHSRSERGS